MQTVPRDVICDLAIPDTLCDFRVLIGQFMRHDVIYESLPISMRHSLYLPVYSELDFQLYSTDRAEI